MTEATKTLIARLERVMVVVLATAGLALGTYAAKAWIARAIPVDVDEISRRWYGDSQGFR